MKIIKATDYGFRKVVQVAINDADPEAIHADGTAHVGNPTTGAAGTEDRARRDAVVAEFDRPAKSWEWCSDCLFNWDVREFVFDGNKTDDEMIAEIQGRLAVRPVIPIDTLQGMII